MTANTSAMVLTVTARADPAWSGCRAWCPRLPYLARTALATVRYEPALRDDDARANALRARPTVLIGYLRCFGYTNADAGSLLRATILTTSHHLRLHLARRAHVCASCLS